MTEVRIPLENLMKIKREVDYWCDTLEEGPVDNSSDVYGTFLDIRTLLGLDNFNTKGEVS